MSKWKGKVVEQGGDSKHHLFDYHEVRLQLVKLFGIPKTPEDHKLLHERCRKVMNCMPCFMIDSKRHKEYHNSYRTKMLPRNIWR